MNAASQHEPFLNGNKNRYSIFRGKNCVRSFCVLRPFLNYGKDTLEDTETFYEFNEAVKVHSGGSLSIDDAHGIHASGDCL